MKIRYHYEDNTKGFYLIERNPEKRVLILDGSPKRVDLPYLYFIVNYVIKLAEDCCFSDEYQRFLAKTNNSKELKVIYSYRGVSGNGLRLFCSDEPIVSLKDRVSYFPTDYGNYGVVCTNHKYDGTYYESSLDLLKEIPTLWYGSNQTIEYNSKWFSKYKVKNQEGWREAGQLIKFFPNLPDCVSNLERIIFSDLRRD